MLIGHVGQSPTLFGFPLAAENFPIRLSDEKHIELKYAEPSVNEHFLIIYLTDIQDKYKASLNILNDT